MFIYHQQQIQTPQEDQEVQLNESIVQKLGKVGSLSIPLTLLQINENEPHNTFVAYIHIRTLFDTTKQVTTETNQERAPT